MRTPSYAAGLALVATVVAGCSGTDSPGRAPAPATSGASGTVGAATPGSATVTAAPALDVQVVAKGLEHGWDLGFLPDGQVLVTERAGRFALASSTQPGARVTRVEADLSDVHAQGEGGLLGMVLHPDFAQSREFTTCQNHAEGGQPVDIRLVTWRLSEDGRSATRVKDLLTGLPTSTGRHSGCRPTIAADGALLVGTGDTAEAKVPQDRTSLGGKVLRLDLKSGEPLPDNPFITSANAHVRYVFTYGHRNIQGVAVRPGSDQVFTAEHGPSFNDEVNLLKAGGNYGWDPSRGGEQAAYDESVPMTDLMRFPDAVPAVWESGETTQAICAAAFVSGSQWGGLDGALVVTALKGAKLLMLTLDTEGALKSVAIPTETNGPFGRLRAARTGPDGALYVTTSNGSDDALLRIAPKG